MEVRYLYSFLLALLLAMAFFPFLIRYSVRWGLVDDSAGNARKIHTGAIPRSGGLGIIVAAAVSILIVLPIAESSFSFLAACFVIICFGLLDDLVELSPIQKLGGQAIGVVVAMMGGMVITDIPFFLDSPPFFSYAVTFLFVMGVINGVNFSDGMDGLAAGTTLMGLVLIFILAIESGNTPVAVISLAISASVLGFLRFNTHPARIFMGDAGSQFLGFALAWLAITVSQSEASQVTKLVPLLILGIPVMDILQVVPVRIHKKLPLPGPDKEHFHHQVAKLGFYQYEVVAITYLLQAILLGTAYILRFENDWLVAAFYAAFVTATLGCIFFANVKGWKCRLPLPHGRHERRNSLFRRFSGLHRHTEIVFNALIVIILISGALFSSELPVGLVYSGFAIGALLTLVKVFYRSCSPVYVGRLASYTAVVLLMYGLALSVGDAFANRVMDSVVALMAILLILSIRITRKEYFGLTTEDLLVAIFFIALAPLLLSEFGRGSMILSLIFRIWVLLYTCEYLLARGQRARDQLTYGSLCALFITILSL